VQAEKGKGKDHTQRSSVGAGTGPTALRCHVRQLVPDALALREGRSAKGEIRVVCEKAATAVSQMNGEKRRIVEGEDKYRGKSDVPGNCIDLCAAFSHSRHSCGSECVAQNQDRVRAQDRGEDIRIRTWAGGGRGNEENDNHRGKGCMEGWDEERREWGEANGLSKAEWATGRGLVNAGHARRGKGAPEEQ
jgi:hypothetical protein